MPGILGALTIMRGSGSKLPVGTDEITCRQFVELVTDYFEGSLASRTLSLVEEHLVMCDWCVTYADQMEDTIAALGRLRESPPSAPTEALLAAFRAGADTAQ